MSFYSGTLWPRHMLLLLLPWIVCWECHKMGTHRHTHAHKPRCSSMQLLAMVHNEVLASPFLTKNQAPAYSMATRHGTARQGTPHFIIS
uniref:Putative secreted protein n=1 Tax=Anopheles darlingi TaxID=43151 RepID=A0A2M4DDJ5_ANODA